MLMLACSWSAWAGTTTSNGFIYKPGEGARGSTEKSVFDAGLDRVDARLGKEIWVGDPNYGTTIQAAITGIGTNNVILRVPARTYIISTNFIIPANITLKLERGAVLSLATGVTLTINGPVDAGLYQIFACTGSGKVDLSSNLVLKEALFDWWGVVGDGATNNKTTLAQAVASGAKRLVLTGPGTYLTDDRMIFTGDGRQVVGVGLPVYQHTGTVVGGYTDAWQFQGTNTLVDGIKFTSAWVGSNKWFIRLGTNGAGGQVGGTVRNCIFNATGFGGVVNEGQSAGFTNDAIIIENNRFLNMGDHAVYLCYPPATFIRGNYFYGPTVDGKFAIQYNRGKLLTNTNVNPVLIDGNTIVNNGILTTNEDASTQTVWMLPYQTT